MGTIKAVPYIKLYRNDASRHSVAESIDHEKDLMQEMKSLTESLVASSVPSEIIALYEIIFLKLNSLFPRMSNDFPQLTDELTEMAERYLVQMMSSYSRLSIRHRSEYFSRILSILKKCSKRLDQVEDLVETRNVSQFQVDMRVFEKIFFPESMDIGNNEKEKPEIHPNQDDGVYY